MAVAGALYRARPRWFTCGVSEMGTILVTGAAGFIGSHVCDTLLQGGFMVRGADNISTGHADNLSQARQRPAFSLLAGDLAEPEFCAQACAGVRHVLHLAAYASVPGSMRDPARCHRDTVTTTLNLLHAAGHAKAARFVLASAAAVYGETPNAPVGEDMALDPLSPYGAAKAAAEMYVRAFAHAGLDGGSLRLFNVYGARQRPDAAYSGVITLFADRLRRGLPLTVFGDGAQTRDYVHVSDIARAFLRALTCKEPLRGRAFNIGTGQAISLLHLADVLGRVLGIEPVIESQPERAGDIRHSWADTARARRVLGFSAEVDIASGLQRVLGKS